mmetsp:Transcript_32331/g.60760  ORF Transcript_32331/g.60760 Transcript_32331/m.60760 type:complete len:405 (-) Transcript_32331:205-1419(-)
MLISNAHVLLGLVVCLSCGQHTMGVINAVEPHSRAGFPRRVLNQDDLLQTMHSSRATNTEDAELPASTGAGAASEDLREYVVTGISSPDQAAPSDNNINNNQGEAFSPNAAAPKGSLQHLHQHLQRAYSGVSQMLDFKKKAQHSSENEGTLGRTKDELHAGMARTGSMEDIQAQEEANMEREVLEGGQAALSAGAKGASEVMGQGSSSSSSKAGPAFQKTMMDYQHKAAREASKLANRVANDERIRNAQKQLTRNSKLMLDKVPVIQKSMTEYQKNAAVRASKIASQVHSVAKDKYNGLAHAAGIGPDPSIFKEQEAAKAHQRAQEIADMQAKQEAKQEAMKAEIQPDPEDFVSIGQLMNLAHKHLKTVGDGLAHAIQAPAVDRYNSPVTQDDATTSKSSKLNA